MDPKPSHKPAPKPCLRGLLLLGGLVVVRGVEALPAPALVHLLRDVDVVVRDLHHVPVEHRNLR